MAKTHDHSCYALASVFIDEAIRLGELHSSLSTINPEVFKAELANDIQQAIEDFISSLQGSNEPDDEPRRSTNAT